MRAGSVSMCILRSVVVFALSFIAAHVKAATLPSGFTETRVAAGLASPTAMTFSPDGRLFVCEQGGRLRVIKNGTLLSQPFMTLSVNSSGERGLLGVAFDPNFESNSYIYVYYTTASSPIHNRVSRFTASAANPDVVAAGSEQILLDLPNLSSATNHNGGAIHFGADGHLYIAVGDNAAPSNAPLLTTTLGKVLRIAADGSIPGDNPFVTQTTGINRAIWARGLRNPFNFAVDRANGRIHVNDVGQDSWEEVNHAIAGANFGWPATEGPNPSGVAGVRYPVYAYQNAGSNCAITGAAFYSPATATFPAEYAGRYFFGDYCGGFIRYASPPGYATAAGFASGISSLVDIQIANDGSLYYLARGGGEVFRVQYTANFAPSITQHPASVVVAAGQSARFQAAASGTAPLAYQWQRNGANIAGANQSAYTIASTASSDSGASFRVVVSNSFGSATSNAATLTVTSNTAPVATISSPAANTTYRGGQAFTFAGSGTDAEDGALAAGALTWRVDFHHDDHTHPHVPPTTGGTGTFTIANRGETSANVFYRVILTARDSGGLTHTASVDVRPLTSVIRLESNIEGAQLTLDGVPIVAPHEFVGVEGVIRSIGAVSPQTSGGTSYDFASWSDGGAQTHEITTPTADTTYTVLYQPGVNTTVYSDTFETQTGWALTSGANTASSGRWERGDPQATGSSGRAMQPGSCAGGSVRCLITGLAAGSSAGANDVDGGLTSIQSPLIAVPATGQITLRFSFYFAHLNNASSADYFRVRVVGASGSAQTVFQRAGSPTHVVAAWSTQTVNLTPFAGQNIRLRFEAADASSASLIEAGVDAVSVTRQ